MADEPDKTGQEPNLELPSLLGFGRKKKRKQDGIPEPEVSESPESTNSTPEVSPEVSPEANAQASSGTAPDAGAEVPPAAPPPDSDPLAADPVAEPRGGLAPAAEKPKRLPPVPPPVAEQNTVRDAEPSVEQDTDRNIAQDYDQETPTQVLPAVSSPPPRRNPHAGVQAAAGSAQQATTAPGPVVTVEEPVVAEEERSGQNPAGRRSSSFTLPALDPRLAAFLTGAIVGVTGVLLGFGAGRACEIVRGVGSCGRIGAFALVLILAVQVLLGAALLNAWRFSDPISTSLLGVGVFAVLVMLFLLGALSSLWTLLFIPLLSGLTYALSWWVTTAFTEKGYRG